MASLEVPDRVRDRVTSIDVETGHLVQMVNELLDLSRIEQGATTLHLDDVPPLELLEATMARVRTFADRAEVTLAVPEPPGPVPPDPGRPGAPGAAGPQPAPQRGQVLVPGRHRHRRRTGERRPGRAERP